MGIPAEHRELSAEAQAGEPDSPMRFLADLLAWRNDRPLLRWKGETVQPPGLAPLIPRGQVRRGRERTLRGEFQLGRSYQRHHPLTCAQTREVMDATRSGIARSAFQASQQAVTMAS